MRKARSTNVVAANTLAVERVIKSKPDKQQEWKVEGVPGLSVVVKPSGHASYYVRFQTGSGSKRVQQRKALGRAGQGGLALADAREMANRLTSEAERGVNLVAVEKAKAQALTLRQLFAERRKYDGRTSARTFENYQLTLDKHVFADLGDRVASELTARHDFSPVLAKIERKSKNVAHMARSALGSTYEWAVRRMTYEDIVENPIKVLAFTHKGAVRKRVLSEAELRKVWGAIGEAKGVGESMRNIIRLAMLTGQRNSEVAGMGRSELKGLDSATPRWDIPGHRMKRKSEDQHVPLSKQALEVVKAAISATPSDVEHVFPADPRGRDNKRQEHIGQESVSRAFAKIAEFAGVSNVRLHDMRKCITTWLAEHGHATPQVLDAILHHGRQGVTGTHYNFALYEGQVRKALQVWADHLTDSASHEVEQPGKVVSLHA